MKNKFRDGVDLANFVNKIKFMSIMSMDDMIFADDGTGLANYGERRPAGRSPDVRASDLDMQNKWWCDGRPPEDHVVHLRDQLQGKNVPTALLDEFEKSAASGSAAFVVGV